MRDYWGSYEVFYIGSDDISTKIAITNQDTTK